MKMLILALAFMTSANAVAETNGRIGSEANCETEVYLAERIIQDAANKDNSQDKAMKAANISIARCEVAAKQFSKSLVKMLDLAKKNCNSAANQGLSDYYRAACYNKAAELVAKITGQ